MAKDIGMTIRKSIVVLFLPCLVAFLGFHPYTYMYVLSFLPAGRAQSVRPAGPKVAFMLSVCVCVCSSANITCAKLRHSVTMPL